MNSYDKLALNIGRIFLATVAVAFTACLTLLGYGSLQVASEALNDKVPEAEELTVAPKRYGFPVESVSFIPNTFPVHVAEVTPVIKEVQLPQLVIKVEKRSGVRGVLAIKLPAKVEAMVVAEVEETVANPLPNIPEWGLIEEATGISIDKAASLDTDLNPAVNELVETIDFGTYLGAVEAELEI